MGMIACPDCGRAVSDQAPSCPGCGRPILAKASPVVVKGGQGIFMKTLDLGCLIVLLAFFLLFLLVVVL